MELCNGIYKYVSVLFGIKRQCEAVCVDVAGWVVPLASFHSVFGWLDAPSHCVLDSITGLMQTT